MKSENVYSLAGWIKLSQVRTDYLIEKNAATRLMGTYNSTFDEYLAKFKRQFPNFKIVDDEKIDL